MTRTLIGPAGNDDGKSSVEMPAYLAGMGLSAYEYSCSKGVKLSPAKAAEIGRLAAENGIFVSIHAPFYINLASVDPDISARSIEYILETLRAAKSMGAGRIVVHCGAPGKGPRDEALIRTKATLAETLLRADAEGLSGAAAICPELLGKQNQLGTLDEILEICSMDEGLVPCIDFGHLYARTGGSLIATEDFVKIFNKTEAELGTERMRSAHIHFSKVQYGNGGERRHLDLGDEDCGPDHRLFLEAVAEKGAHPVIICESKSERSLDARVMLDYYDSLKEDK